MTFGNNRVILGIAATAVILAAVSRNVEAACDNACSGHGTCSADDVCTCYHNYRMGDEDGGDCSDRVCPFEIAWVDHPSASGTFHNYAECAGRGICNRQSGECECFEGYTGKGCQRTACPNDCSGHGTCEYIEELGFGSHYGAYVTGATGDDFGQRSKTFAVTDWDSHKTMGCVCDPRWAGLDCSRRMCPKGNDIMDRMHDKNDANSDNQEQEITFVVEGTARSPLVGDVRDLLGKKFALTFISTLNETYTTYPIKIPTVNSVNGGSCGDGSAPDAFTAACCTDLSSSVSAALLRLPHRVVDGVTVSCVPVSTTGFTISVEFTGEAVKGPQNLLQVEDYVCDAGCTPKIDKGSSLILDHFSATKSTVKEVTNSEFNNYECGRRGKCDYGTGLCECFDGYYGESCSFQTALV